MNIYEPCRGCGINTRTAGKCSCGLCPLCCDQQCPAASCDPHKAAEPVFEPAEVHELTNSLTGRDEGWTSEEIWAREG